MRLSTVIFSIRSYPGWDISIILPLCRCLRKSMQNIGATFGFSFAAAVKCTRAFDGLAEITSLYELVKVRTERRISSRSGWSAFSILPPVSFSESSRFKAYITTLSNAIAISSVGKNLQHNNYTTQSDKIQI